VVITQKIRDLGGPRQTTANPEVKGPERLFRERNVTRRDMSGQRHVNSRSFDGGRHSYTERMATTSTATLGPAARPVVVPAALSDASALKAHGRIELPLHIRWSGPPVTYDLEDCADRARVYEQVLREGTEDDVRFYVEEDHLLELWDELVLPPAVREAWRPWIEDRGRSR
jgi:hypothetical protein